MGECSFRTVDRDRNRGTTVIATTPNQAGTVEAALIGILAATDNDRPSDASVSEEPGLTKITATLESAPAVRTP